MMCFYFLCTIERYRSLSWKLFDAKGNLASLAGCNGFRSYVKAIAESIGITGSIRREEQYNITLIFEGKNEQVNAFIEKLQEMYSQGMYSSIRPMSDEIIISRSNIEFTIRENFSRSATKIGHYSGHEYDKLTDASGEREILMGSQISR